MTDPINLPARTERWFVCINLVTGHIRNAKKMTAEIAVRINSFDHMRDTGYKWLWNDQQDFNDALDYNSPIVLKL